MFERLLQELENLKTTKVSVPIDADGDGYYDKECPNKDCEFEFKIYESDWEDLKKTDKVFCPMCRHEEKSDSWWTKEQLAQAKEQAIKYVKGKIGNALKVGASQFNSPRSKDSFIQMTMSVSNSSPHHYVVPISANEEMRVKIQCEQCSCRYSIIGSAFFCPRCGHNSAEETFHNSLLKIENKIKNVDVIRKAVEEVSKDEAETTCRSIIETSLNECVVAFQRFCEVTFCKRMPSTKIKFNAFQNLEVGSEYWRLAFNESYSDWLTPDEYKKLNELFQKRHLLSHTEGIIDQKYLDKTDDMNYRVGQRIVVKDKDVMEMIFLVKKTAKNIREK